MRVKFSYGDNVISALKHRVILNAKNIIGWQTKRRIVVFSVDDYGNVRVDSRAAREQMRNQGLKINNRFDAYDALETRADLEALFDVLTSVTDSKGSHAVCTPFAVPCNIDFEKVRDTGCREYHYERLPETFRKQSARHPEAYEGAWELWQEGVQGGFMAPQFHGREHVNLKVFEEQLAAKNQELLIALQNRSYSSISLSGYNTISPMAAFDFWNFCENNHFDGVIRDGLEAFEQVFGYRSEHFNPPAGREHPAIHSALHEHGIKYIDTPLLKREHQGKGKYKRVFNYTGKRNQLGQIFLVRNVVFEPTDDRGFNWVNYAMNQIEAAFRWNRPAIISSHRVNFCGHIDEKNRKEGLRALQQLLNRITERWPEVEFMSANNLGALIESE